MAAPPNHDFSDPKLVADYAEVPKRNVPGHGGLLQMARVLLAERVPDDGRVLVVGAGGGLEIEDFADAHAAWRFDGVDPSEAMIGLARHRLARHRARVTLITGDVHDAPDGPYDGATCLLTLHFVPAAERAAMLAQIRRRLAPGARFVVAHLSVPDDEARRDVWLSRYAAYLAASGVDPAKTAIARGKIKAELTVLSPEREEAMLRDAGFGDVALFYAGFAFRGWVAIA